MQQPEDGDDPAGGIEPLKVDPAGRTEGSLITALTVTVVAVPTAADAGLTDAESTTRADQALSGLSVQRRNPHTRTCKVFFT